MHRALFQCVLIALLLIVNGARAQLGNDPAAQPAPAVLFENVRVFDGLGDSLGPPRHVLVRGNTIERISATPIEPRAGDTVIAGDGRTLMPGLIDAHTHLMLEGVSMLAAMRSDSEYLTLVAARSAEGHLMRGFTTVRDAGGATFALKRAIDQGLYPGPRIYPSGAMVSQTSGHGDFRSRTELPREPGAPLSYPERVGMVAIADGRDQVLRAVRENLMRGATQIKLMAGGGVSSDYDPLDVTQYTLDEMRAAVEAASHWGTYVTVHAYTPHAVRQAIEAGVRCIEHGQLLDEDTMRLVAERGVWLCLQPFLDDQDANPKPEGSPQRLKQIEVSQGTDRAYRLARELGVKVAFGTDTLFSPANATRQGAQLAKLTRWHTPAQVLRMATSRNAELLAMSGPRNPYPGRLGVVQEGALADLILVEGDPLANLDLIADPDRNFVVIMKDGKVYKNTVGVGGVAGGR